ncbi:MAG: hypothetical protein GW948_02170 [Rhodobacterales bacterium]|nr:hypothetical protein [Rhodobacterales bacterium]
MSQSANLASLGAIALPAPPAGRDVPEWIQLMPAGQFRAIDGRGPWRLENAEGVIAASFAAAARIHVDENHSTITAAKMGLSAPARGYIVEMEARADGIWARVDWTEAGARMLRDREYWGISPTFSYDTSGRVLRIKNAALTNDPALRELVALNSAQNEETGMEPLQEIAGLVGLAADASLDDVRAAITALQTAVPQGEAALSALGQVTGALGLSEGAGATELVAAAAALRAGAGETGEQLAALQAEVRSLREGEQRRAAEAFVATAIADKRAGVSAAREHYVALHMENPTRAAALVAVLPKLGETGLKNDPPKLGERQASLSVEEKQVADALGLNPETYLAQLQADAKAKEAR